MDNPVVIELQGRYRGHCITITLQNDFVTVCKDTRDAIETIWVITAERFLSRFEIMLEIGEFVGLVRTLQEVYEQVGKECEIQFPLDYASIILTFKLSKLGHLEVETQVHTELVSLTCDLIADQSYIPLWIREIKGALLHFL